MRQKNKASSCSQKEAYNKNTTMPRGSNTEIPQEAEEEAPIHGDLLEAILSHVPLIDLVSASHVSRAWSQSVSSSLHNLNQPKPWLVVLAQTTRSLPYASCAVHAYDPRSDVWVEVPQPKIVCFSAVRSSSSNFVYMLSPSKLSFSADPLHQTWDEADAPPLVWRTDPIVALVGHRVVVAGGACDFEDDPLAVEIYDLKSHRWETCDSMPEALKDSASSTWLSAANDDSRLYVMEKFSGVTHWFNVDTKIWHGPYNLRPDPLVFYSIIGFSGNNLILIGLVRDSEIGETVKLWAVDSEKLDWEEIAVMPRMLAERLKSESFEISAIGACLAENFACIYNPSELENVVVCEFCSGGGRWRSIRNAVANDRDRMGRFVLSCSEVSLDDLQRTMNSGGHRSSPFSREKMIGLSEN